MLWSLLDPDRIRVALAALAGAFVYGVYTLTTLLLARERVSRRDLARAGLNVLAATLCGVVTAVVVAPAVAALIPWVSPARLLNDPDYQRWVPTLGLLPIHVLDSETLFPPVNPNDI